MTLADGRRPRSAPAGFRARVSGERGEWKRDGHKEASEGVRQEELEELEEEAAGVCGVRRGAGGDGWRSRSRDGRAPHGERPRHQVCVCVCALAFPVRRTPEVYPCWLAMSIERSQGYYLRYNACEREL